VGCIRTYGARKRLEIGPSSPLSALDSRLQVSPRLCLRPNLSLQDTRLNTVMKKLTGWAAIIAVPTGHLYVAFRRRGWV